MTNNIFFKYHSLGNDFVVFDWFQQSTFEVEQELTAPSWPAHVIAWCNRHTGIGADGVLVLTNNGTMPLVRIFNADGTQAEMCLNGLRCIAQHLIAYHKFSGIFSIIMGNRTITVNQVDDQIRSRIPSVTYQKSHVLTYSQGTLSGHCADAGNPHFIVFQEVTLSWLEQHGKEFESHQDFPFKANISFVWLVKPGQAGEKNKQSYQVLVFERGCGITQACSSAGAAILKTLAQLNMINPNDVVTLQMLGGNLSGFVDADDMVVLQASAVPVFQGEL